MSGARSGIAEQLPEAIIREVAAFVVGAERHDDLTVVVRRVAG